MTVYSVFFRLISVNIIVSECQNPLDFKKSYVHTVLLRLNSFGTLFVNSFSRRRRISEGARSLDFRCVRCPVCLRAWGNRSWNRRVRFC